MIFSKPSKQWIQVLIQLIKFIKPFQSVLIFYIRNLGHHRLLNGQNQELSLCLLCQISKIVPQWKCLRGLRLPLGRRGLMLITWQGYWRIGLAESPLLRKFSMRTCMHQVNSREDRCRDQAVAWWFKALILPKSVKSMTQKPFNVTQECSKNWYKRVPWKSK